jgi:phosphoribosylamine---glycine ligase
MNVLILGSGGRECAFAWKLAQSKKIGKLYIAPGNAGSSDYGTNLSIAVTDFAGIKAAVLAYKIELVIVGPEDPLVKGIVDFFKKEKELKKIMIIGPDALGAQLEGSKDFSKAFMQKYGVPTAASATFGVRDLEAGLAYLKTQKGPFVLKADGLAAGKGVIITESLSEAEQSLKEMLAGQFGAASEKVLVEQFLKGIELSVFVLTDGKNYLILPEAKDYKRIGEKDTGPNTGGMGAVSPVPFADTSFMQKVEEQVVKPTLAGLNAEGIKYVGFIFIGLMNDAGQPYVIEYNARMGDPETEVVLPRIKTDLLKVMVAAAKGKLDKIKLNIDKKTAVTTICVAGGYPGDYKKGHEISLPSPDSNTMIFHAGTLEKEGLVLTNGGRVLAMTAMAKTLNAAIKKSQKLARATKYKGKYYRKDIGQDLQSLAEKV